MLCPVCLAPITADDGVVKMHHDGIGKICPMSGREPYIWDEDATRNAVPNRSNGYCEFCGERAAEMHHRIARSQGGSWSPANILHLCSPCHRYYTEHPKVAYWLGVSVRRNGNPAHIPVKTPRGELLLSDDVAPPIPSWAR